MTIDGPVVPKDYQDAAAGAINEHDTLKYHLLGPSLTKAGQDSVDQQKVILYHSFGVQPSELTVRAGLRSNLQCLQRLEVLQQ